MGMVLHVLSRDDLVKLWRLIVYSDRRGILVGRGRYAQLGQDGDGMDLDHCAQLCEDKKFTLAGVEDGHQCFW